MRDIKLCFRGVIDNQVKVYIYDNNKLMCCGTTECGCITFCLEESKAYRLEARMFGYCLNTSFYVGNYNCLYFSFNNLYQRNIIFTLRDYYYNLPIMKGELILWQK